MGVKVAQYVLFQPSTGGFVSQFTEAGNGSCILGFVEIAADAVHGTKASLTSLLDTIDLYRPSVAETLMLVRTE